MQSVSVSQNSIAVHYRVIGYAYEYDVTNTLSAKFST